MQAIPEAPVLQEKRASPERQVFAVRPSTLLMADLLGKETDLMSALK